MTVLRSVLMVAVVLCFSLHASAADYLWNNASGGSFGSPSNWLIWNGSAWVPTGAVPSSTFNDNVYFDGMNSGASTSSNVSRSVINHYTRGNSTLRFGDGSSFGNYNANYLGVSNGAEQRLVDGTFNIGYADLRSYYYSYLTISGANTLANIGTLRTAEAEAFNGDASGRLTVSEGAKVYANKLYHQRYYSTGYSDYAWHVHGTNSLLQVTGSSVDFYNARANAWVQNGGVMDLGSATGAFMNAIALTNGVFMANKFSASSVFGHGVLVTNFNDTSVTNNYAASSADGAVNIASNINIRHLNAYVYSNAISQFSGRIDMGGGSIITDSGNSVRGLQLTGSGILFGHGIVYLGSSGLYGSSGTKLSPNGGTLSIYQEGNSTFSGQIDNTGTLAKTGAGILTWNSGTTQTFGGSLRVDAGTFHLSGNGMLGGPIVVNGGTLQVDPAHRIGDTASVTVNGGTLFINSYNEEFGSLSGTGGAVNIGVANVRVNQTAVGSYRGTLAGTGSSVLVKAGSEILNWYTNVTHTFGGRVQVDQGTFHLTGDGSVGGGVTVNGGLLQVDPAHRLSDSSSVIINGGQLFFNSYNEEMGSLSGSGGILNLGVANLRVNQLGNASFGGVLQGTASSTFTKTGSAYLDLLGTSANTFLGTIQVDQGILFLNKTGVVATSGNSIVNGGNLWIYQSDQILDSGSVQINSGTFTVGTGSTTVAERIAGVTGSGTIDIRANGGLVIDNASNITYSGTITGAGQLVKEGAGQWLLNGTANYTGGTTINNGILRGSTASLQGNIGGASSGILYFDQTSSGTYAGNLSGAINYQQSMDPGNVLTLTGTNTHSGTTLIGTGELRAGSNGAFSQNSIYELGNNASAILNTNGQNVTIGGLRGGGSIGGTVNVTGGYLNIIQWANTTYSGVINGTGTIHKQGTGTLTLTGTGNNYSGTFEVNSSRVNFNGFLGLSAVSANGGGTVGGTGLINVLYMNGGNVSPGMSAGSLSVDRLEAYEGKYQWELAAFSTVNPGVNYDQIRVLSRANFYDSAQLSLNFIGSATNPDGGDTFWLLARQWTIVDGTNATLSGNYGSITNPTWNAGNFSLTNTGTELVLSWTPVPEPGLVLGMVSAVLGLARSGFRRHRPH
jgi:autotransporter-associated beta strand protein